MSMRRVRVERYAPAAPTVGSNHVSFYPGFVYEDEPSRIHLAQNMTGPGSAPALHVRPVLFLCEHGFF